MLTDSMNVPTVKPIVKKVRSRGSATPLRVLDAAYALISAHGIGAVTMVEISKAAGVTEMTVYNLFKSKNQLLSKLVEKYQQDLIDRMGEEDESTMAGILRAVRRIALELGQNPRWSGAIAHLYFSEKSDSATYRRLHDIGLRHLRLAVDLMAADGHILRADDLEMAQHQFANTGYALVHDLAIGRIDGEQLANHLEYSLKSTISFLFLGNQN